MYFKFLALVFLDFVYMLRYGNMDVEYGFIDVLMSLRYGFCWFCWYNAYSTCFTCLFFIFMHSTMFVLNCAYHVHDKMSLRYFCVSLDSIEYKVCRDNHVSLILKHLMIMCFYSLP